MIKNTGSAYQPKQFLMYCLNTHKTDILKHILEETADYTKAEFKVLLDIELKNSIALSNQDCVFVTKPELYALLNKNNTPVVVVDADKAAGVKDIKLWLKKCLATVTNDSTILVAGDQPVKIKEKLISQCWFSLSGSDLQEAGCPFICVPSTVFAQYVFNTKDISSFLKKSKKPGLSFYYTDGHHSPDRSITLLSSIKKKLGENFRVFSMFSGKAKGSRPSLLPLLFRCCVFSLMLLMPLLSKDYGISGDEEKHHQQASLVYNYFAHSDTTALNQPKTLLHFYGQSFDLLDFCVIKFFNTTAVYETRHYLNACCGFIGILFTALCALRLGGYLAGIIALLLITFTPAFFGHSMNNSIDIPFATSFAGSIYYIIQIILHYPKIRLNYILMLVFFVAMAISIRVGGLLLIGYILITAGLLALNLMRSYKYSLRNAAKELRVIGAGAVVVCLAAYFIGLSAWPYALQHPLSNPFIALQSLTNISVSINQLFEGHIVKSNELPWYFLIKNMGITIPLLVWAGLFCSILFIFKWGKASQLYLFILFTVLFPIVYITYKNSNVYGSWRHVLFVYPGMVVLASIGWLHLYKAVKHFLFKIAVASVFLLLLFSPLRFMYMNHPFDYLYFNELAGGLSQAWKQYESDYYTNAIRPASEWLRNNQEFKKMNAEHEVKIVSNMTSSVNYYFKDVKNIKVLYSRYYEKNLLDWDYAIYYLGYINEYQLQHGLWPSSDNVYVVYADQAPVAVVLKRVNKEDLAGFNASNQRQFIEAVHHFETYLHSDPYCVKVNLAMAEALALSGKTKAALQYARLAVSLYPDYSLGNKMLGWIQLQDNDNTAAIHSFEKLLELDTDDYMGWYYLSIAYYNEKQYAPAMNCAEKSLAIEPENPDVKKVWELANLAAKSN